MEWKSNARYNQPVESGTVFELKGSSRIAIHTVHGLGEQWYLSCYPLCIDNVPLNTEDFNTAVENAKAIIRKKLHEILDTYAVFASDASENEIVRY